MVFTWQGHLENSKVYLWRVDADGANLQRLTQGVADVGPYCSADGQRVYYSDLVNARIMRIGVAGGEAEIVKEARDAVGSVWHGSFAGWKAADVYDVERRDGLTKPFQDFQLIIQTYSIQKNYKLDFACCLRPTRLVRFK